MANQEPPGLLPPNLTKTRLAETVSAAIADKKIQKIKLTPTNQAVLRKFFILSIIFSLLGYGLRGKKRNSSIPLFLASPPFRVIPSV
jgi:hypothetical protein